MEKTHWKKLTNPNYLGSWDFEQDEERTLTIKKVYKEKVTDQNGNQEEVVSMDFITGKPMILNKTNLKAIEKSTGTAYIEQWVGKSISLFTKRIRAFGEDVDALRVSPSAPKEVKKPSLDEKRFLSALEAIQSGSYTAEKLKQEYLLTQTQLDQL